MINKNVLKALVLMFFIFGCGGVLKDTVVPAENSALRYSATENRLAIEGVREVALFPFADYSHQQNLLHAELWGGNIKILEEITDHFIKNGILVAVQEDVNTVLVDNNVIQPLANQQLIYGSDGDEKTKFRTKVIGTPEYDLINVEHSDDMKEEIINVIKSEMALEKARKTLADHINALPSEIVFTSSGSESDNLALRGIALAARQKKKGNHLLISPIEHPAVLETADHLAKLHGFEISFVFLIKAFLFLCLCCRLLNFLTHSLNLLHGLFCLLHHVLHFRRDFSVFIQQFLNRWRQESFPTFGHLFCIRQIH